MTFAAMYGCAQEGIALMSIPLPQLAAMVLFIVIMLVYDAMAAIEELYKDG